MKKIFYTLLITAMQLNAADASSATMSAEEIELERQRLEIERARFELEKEKFELARQKEQQKKQAIVEEQPPAQTDYRPARERLAPPKKHYAKDLYIGLDYVFSGQGERTVTINDTDLPDESFTATGSGFKFGFGAPNENRVEIFYTQDRLSFEESANDWDITMYGIDYLWVFDEAFGKDLSPYIKVGLLTAKSDNYIKTLEEMGYPVGSGNSEINGAGFHFGYGLFARLDEEFEATVGVNGSGITWQEITLSNASSSYKVEISDTISTLFVNIDYFF